MKQAEAVKRSGPVDEADGIFLPTKLGIPNYVNSLTLAQQADGAVVKVARVRGGGAIRQRLLDMGIGRGAEMTVIRKAPLNDPLEVSVRGTILALRMTECALIDVQLVPGGSRHV